MLETYRSLLSIPHARAFVLAGFVARLSISMRALGAVLMISQLTGSYGLAGAVAAAALLGEAVAAPRLGRLVDRFGQRRVLLLSLAVHTRSPRPPLREAQEGVRRSWRRRTFGS
jgi:MFS family permease